MLNHFQAHGLKHISSVSRLETKPYRDRVDQPLVSHDQGFPGLRISRQAQRYEFRVAERFVFCRGHYRRFLDFQNECRPNERVNSARTAAEKNCQPPVSSAAVCFRYSCTAWKPKAAPNAINSAPLTSSQSW